MKRHLLASVASLTLLAPAVAWAEPEPTSEPIDDVATVEAVIVVAMRDPELPPIVASTRDRLSRTPGAVSIIANETFENRAAQGVSDMLRDVPGVLAQKRYGEESRLSIRGSGVSQGFHQRGVLLAQDGVSFADGDGFSDFQGVDPLTARYVEVYRGGNALRFGGAQLGGAVNVVTPTGRTAESANLLRFEGGSFGTARAQGSIARIAGDWDVYANADGLVAEGWRAQSEQSQARATINVGRRFGEDRQVRLIVYGADLKQEVPGSLTLAQALTAPRTAPPVNLANDYARDLSLMRTSLQTRWRLSDALVFEGGVYATTKSLYHPIYQVLDQEGQTQGLFGRFDWAGQIAAMDADLYYGLSYRQGDLKAQQFVNVGGLRGARTADALQNASGLDVFAEGRLFVRPELALVGGGSWGRATRDYARRTGAAFSASRDFDWFAPRAGLLWQAKDGPQVYANLTRSVEPPTFGAMVQGAAPNFVPITPQKAWTGEVGTRGRRGDLTWDVTLYRAEVEDEILTYQTAPNVALTLNADRTIHQGLEAALDWRLPVRGPADGLWMLRQSYAYSDFRFDGDAAYGDNRLPVVPEHQYRASLKYAHPAGWFVTPSVEWRPADVWVDYANTLKAPGFAVWSVNTGWDLAKGVTLFVDARNLTDERYTAEFSAVTDARLPTVSKAVFVPGEGRSVFTGLRYRF